MLTSPANVTITATNGVALKANTAASDHGARREPPLLPHQRAQQAETVIEPELPSNSPLTSVNAVTATVGNRTVLQELTLNVATMLRIARRADENLTSLFLRIIATIEAMPQAERLQLEVRAGLKPLKITLADLAMALRKPDGQEAARLTALAEAPTAIPGRTAANAATTTYLEEGTDSGHTEETLAMRAAARHSAAGQSVFSAESKMRPVEAQPADAKVLQSHLKTMFEPGETNVPQNQLKRMLEPGVAGLAGQENDAAIPVEGQDDAGTPKPIAAQEGSDKKDRASAGNMNAKALPREVPLSNLRQPMPLASGNAADPVTFSSASLNLDPSTVEKIRNVAQAIANLAETIRADQERPAPEKLEDRRVQTMLTLKGLAEVVTAIPAKAAELLAAVVAEAAAPLPELADDQSPIRAEPLQQVFDDQRRSNIVATSDMTKAPEAFAHASPEEMPVEAPSENNVPTVGRPKVETETTAADKHQIATDADGLPLARPDLAQHAVPFAYAQVQPAREEMLQTIEEEDGREETDEDGEDDGDEDGEPRRPRDEYDAIHDPLPEEEPEIVINRDSSEADRAFALYQRMGGF